MLCNPVIVVGLNDALAEFPNAPSGVVTAVSVKPEELISYKKNILELFITQSASYCICLDLRMAGSCKFVPDEKLLHALALFSFCENYAKRDGKPFVIVLSQNDKVSELGFIPVFLNLFLGQGYPGIEFFPLFEAQGPGFGWQKTFCSFVLPQGLPNRESLNSLDPHYDTWRIIDSEVIILTESLSTSLALLDQIRKYENNIATLYSAKYEEMQRIADMKREYRKTMENLKRTRFELKNYEGYQGMLRKDSGKIIEWYKSENESIKSWYHKEYEELPLWYKQLGHILKWLKKSLRI